MGESSRSYPCSAGCLTGSAGYVAQPLSQIINSAATSLLYGHDAILYQSTQTTLRLAKDNLSKLFLKRVSNMLHTVVTKSNVNTESLAFKVT